MDVQNEGTLSVGGGCFWCIEAIFQQLKGVEKVVSGYSGGNTPWHPTYREVGSGRTGHAEVVQVTFDSSIVSYEELLLVFMTSHDPTSKNQQGKDIGSQYRSVVFYRNDEEKEIAEEYVKQLAPYFDNPITTELTEFEAFYKAEDEHQNFYNENSEESYCSALIAPKIQKLRKRYAAMVKPFYATT